jgi:cytochrome b561
MKHSWLTRAMHLLVAAAVVFQLANAQLMRVPWPGRPPLSHFEAGAFALHEYAGLVSLAIVALFWLWLLVRRKGTDLGTLFPWFSRRRLADLREDILLHVRSAAQLALPDPDRAVALPSAVQGVGLVLALVVVITGTVGFFYWTEGTPPTGLVRVAVEIHGTLANVMWGYLVVHVGAALLHELLGHRILYQMSPMRQASPPAPSSGPLAGVEDASGLRD